MSVFPPSPNTPCIQPFERGPSYVIWLLNIQSRADWVLCPGCTTARGQNGSKVPPNYRGRNGKSKAVIWGITLWMGDKMDCISTCLTGLTSDSECEQKRWQNILLQYVHLRFYGITRQRKLKVKSWWKKIKSLSLWLVARCYQTWHLSTTRHIYTRFLK